MTYSILFPPDATRLNDFSEVETTQLIRYENHPAYKKLMIEASPLLRLKAINIFFRSLFLIKIKRSVRYEMIPLHVRKGSRLGFIAAAFSNLLKPTSAKNAETMSEGLSELDMTFRRQGVAALTMQSDDFQKIHAVSLDRFKVLEARRAATVNGERDFEASRSYARRDESAELFIAIESLFERSGVMATATAYLGRPAKLVDVNPQINDLSDDFWRRVFPDLPDYPVPATAYFHRDASGGDIKAIIYMSNVSPDNGPFGYVIGSHRMAISTSDDHICEANDSSGLSGTGLRNRALFAALPKKFRQKCSFGNDVLDQEPLSRDILDALWTITAPKGSIVMFDTKGVHRGGMVVQGERRVITCVLG